MNTFPHTLHSPRRESSFSDEKSDEAVLVASYASGYPLMNKQFTFDPRTFGFEMRHVTDANKSTFVAFYEANKDVPFYWTNEQDDVQYEVAFVGKPSCRLDDQKDFWRIRFEFIQTSPNTIP